jgi:prepilin-type processing-associated H-X9-DG protein
MRHSNAAIISYADGHVAPVLSSPIIAKADTNIYTGLATGANLLTVDPNSAWTESDNNGGQVANYYAKYNATGGNPTTNTCLEIRANGDFKYVQATCDLTSSKISKSLTFPSPHYWMLATDMKINNSQGGAGVTVGIADSSSNLIGKVYFDLPNNSTPIAQNMSLNGTTLYAYDRGTSYPRDGYKSMKIIGSSAGIILIYFDKVGAPFVKTLPVMSGTTWNTAKYVIFKINSSNTDPRIWASNTMFGSM